jgi:hypothetical protein
MSFRVLILDEVYAEVEVQVEYEEIRRGLGEKFVASFNEVLDTIKMQPYSFEIKKRNIRQVKLNRFPYFALFKVSGNEVIVYRIYHAKRSHKKRYKF